MLRFLLWRLLGLLAVLVGLALIAWFLDGGPGEVLRGRGAASVFPRSVVALAGTLERHAQAILHWAPELGLAPAKLLIALVTTPALVLTCTRARARRRRRYARFRVEAYRADQASAEAVVAMFGALHKRVLQRWWRRLALGQPSLALEVHHSGDLPHSVWLAVSCLSGQERAIEAVLQATYPNCRLLPSDKSVGVPPAVLRLKKHAVFIKRVKSLEDFQRTREPPVNRLLTIVGACEERAYVQIAMTPTPALFETFAKHLYRRHETRLSRERRQHLLVRDRSMVEDAELRGGLEVQHRPLFFVDLRVIGPNRAVCERIASELRSDTAENRLVERGTFVRHGMLGLYGRRVQRGEGNPLPSVRKGVFASGELAPIWQLPSVDYVTVPFARSSLPLAPAPPGIFRPGDGRGTLRDALGAVSIHVGLRKQNTAVPGTVEQGKSSYLVATIAEDLRRDRCAVIVLDPKGDAAEAAMSVVPVERTCTLLDFAHPTCGFNPLAVDAPPDVIADYVVAALEEPVHRRRHPRFL